MLLKKIQAHKELLIFILLYCTIIVWKFFGLVFGEGILPGGDTLGHFFAFTEYSKALGQFQLYSYTNSWFSGMPLFQFYSPLLFLLMFVVKIGFGWLLADEIIFRLVVFISFVWFPIPFYFFLKEFFDTKTARVGIWFSFLWIFFPKFLGSLGIGVGGAVFYGLFNQVFAVSLVLLFLVFLHRLLGSNEKIKQNITWTAVLLATIILTHLLSAVAVIILTGLFIFYKKEYFYLPNIKKILWFIFFSFLFTAWWTIPFLTTFTYQSGNAQTLSIYLTSPLIGLFPFDLSQLMRGQFLEFGYMWLLLLIFFIFGFVFLIKKKNTLLPFLFITGFFLLTADFFASTFPEIPFHYYRFIPYLFVIELAIATIGLMCCLEWLKKRWYLFYVFCFLVIGIFGLLVWGYGLGKGNDNILTSPRLTRLNSDVQYYNSLEQYPLHAEAQQFIYKMKGMELQPFRVLTDMPQIWFMQNLSSMHYFNTLLPLKNSQAVVNGLYAESAWQLPFIFPVISKVTNTNISWGRVQDLSQNYFFVNQSLPEMFKRLSLFGVDYFLQVGLPREDLKSASSTVSVVGNTENFSLFFLADAKDKVYAPTYRPGVFLQCESGADEFRKFSLGWYSVVNNLDHPIIDGGVISEKNDSLIDEHTGFIVLLMNKKDTSCLRLADTIDKPILFLNTTDNYFGVTDAEQRRLEIKNFSPVAHYDNRGVWAQPNVVGLQEMSDFILNHQQVLEKSNIQLTDWENNKVSFTGSGPVIVNLSYFPYWQSSSAKVYPVTPGQMLVFANGETILEYKGRLDTKIGLSLSILSYIFVFGYFIVRSVLRKKNNK